MKRKNTSRNALVTSIISMLLCVSMLVGTTFAWFTDEVKSANNIIKSGNLDIVLEYWDGDSWEDVQGKSDILAGDLWEPGYVDVAYLRLKNAGSLALKYQLGVNIIEELPGVNQAGAEFKLSDYIYFDIVEGVNGETDAYANRAAAMAVATETTLISTGYSKAGALEAETDYTYLAMVVYMPTTVGNVANHNGTNVPKIDLGINVFATQFTKESDSFDENYDGGAQWSTDASIGWYLEGQDTGEYVIGSAEDLAGLAAIVNGTATGETATYALRATTETIKDDFAGKTVKLASDIDLAGKAWTPIGNWDNTFNGTFDGQGYTISNLYINAPEGEGVGLFGVVQNATIKGINVKNVKISGYSMVAGVVGAAYPANISDCNIAGDVEIVADWAYVAGVAGYCYYGTQVDGCSVIAEGTGLVQSNTRNAVGGITAWLLEGDHKVTDCHVKNLNLVGWTNVGGITGFVHYNNTIEGCSVENVKLTKTRQDGNPGIGLIAGGWGYHASNAITLRSNTAKNATMEGYHVAYAAYNELYGSEYGGATTTNFVLENNTTEGITNNLVEVKVISDAAGLKEAFTTGGNYALSNKVNNVEDWTLELAETVTVPAGVDVTLYMNGKTIAGTLTGTGNQDLFLVKGNLTVKDGTIELSVTQNQGWNAMSAIFDITAGGVVNLDNVVAENKGGTDMNFVAHLNNWGEVTLNAVDCDLKATYMPVRVFNSGNDMNNVTIQNSTLTGKYCFWVHNYTLADFGTAEKVEAHKALFNFKIFDNGNTFNYTGKAPVMYGFTDPVYLNADGVTNATEFYKETQNSNKITLDSNIRTSDSTQRYGSGYESIVMGGRDVTIDLNGQTITHDSTHQDGKNTGYTYMFTVNQAGTKLTIDGNGKINSANSEGYACVLNAKSGTTLTVNSGEFTVDRGIAVWAGNGSHVIINDGSFVSTGSAGNEELIYSSGGVIDIYGGFFHNTEWEERPVNIANANRGTGRINIYGGTFVNCDPSTGCDDPGQIKVAEGYKVVSETQTNGDVWYTVVPA